MRRYESYSIANFPPETNQQPATLFLDREPGMVNPVAFASSKKFLVTFTVARGWDALTEQGAEKSECPRNELKNRVI